MPGRRPVRDLDVGGDPAGGRGSGRAVHVRHRRIDAVARASVDDHAGARLAQSLGDRESDPLGGAGVIAGASARPRRNVAEGAKNALPVTAVEKSSRRSWSPGGSPMNMRSSIFSITASDLLYPMK